MAVFTKKSPHANHKVPKPVVANPIVAKPTKPNIAIIGSGVSGLTCAYYLKDSHAVTVFESNDYIGGHVNTLDVTVTERSLFDNPFFNNPFRPSTEKVAIDTGFIVFNERTYPNFIRLLDELNVPFQKAVYF
jgi:uncharacterized protein